MEVKWHYRLRPAGGSLEGRTWIQRAVGTLEEAKEDRLVWTDLYHVDDTQATRALSDEENVV